MKLAHRVHVHFNLPFLVHYRYAAGMFIAVIIMLALCVGCSEAPQKLSSPWQEIAGRDDGPTTSRYPIYRGRSPAQWRRVDPTASNIDTRQPLCDFYIDDPAGIIRIAVHNFPSDRLEERIPPAAQIVRWQRQQGFVDATDSQTTPIAHGGFTGLKLSGQGILAWAMQLSPMHYRSLQLPGNSQEIAFLRQMRSDYTIKATGPQEALERHRHDIEAFAMSFELIQEVPSQL